MGGVQRQDGVGSSRMSRTFLDLIKADAATTLSADYPAMWGFASIGFSFLAIGLLLYVVLALIWSRDELFYDLKNPSRFIPPRDLAGWLGVAIGGLMSWHFQGNSLAQRLSFVPYVMGILTAFVLGDMQYEDLYELATLRVWGAIGRRFCAATTYERIFAQILNGIEVERRDALSRGAPWQATLIMLRGSCSFMQAAVSHLILCVSQLLLLNIDGP